MNTEKEPVKITPLHTKLVVTSYGLLKIEMTILFKNDDEFELKKTSR